MNRNLLFIILAGAPVILVLLLLGKITAHPYSKIYGNNGIEMSKPGFVLVITGVSILGYYISLFASNQLIDFYAGISVFKYRAAISIFFVLASIALIFSNTIFF